VVAGDADLGVAAGFPDVFGHCAASGGAVARTIAEA